MTKNKNFYNSEESTTILTGSNPKRKYMQFIVDYDGEYEITFPLNPKSSMRVNLKSGDSIAIRKL